MAYKNDQPKTRGAAKGSTPFSHKETGNHETSFVAPDIISSGRKPEDTRIEMESTPFHSSEAMEDASTASLRPRPQLDPRELVLVAPGYPVPVGIPLAPPFHPSRKTQLAGPSRPHSHRSQYKLMKPIKVKYFVVLMGLFFLAALIVAMFMAIYFGHKY